MWFLLCLLLVALKAKTLKGSISGLQSLPLSKLKILMNEDEFAATTDTDGQFTIDLPPEVTQVTLTVDSKVNHFKPMIVTVTPGD